MISWFAHVIHLKTLIATVTIAVVINKNIIWNIDSTYMNIKEKENSWNAKSCSFQEFLPRTSSRHLPLFAQQDRIYIQTEMVLH